MFFTLYGSSISLYFTLIHLSLILSSYIVLLLEFLYYFIERHPNELFIVFCDLFTFGRRLVDGLKDSLPDVFFLFFCQRGR